MTQPVFDVAQLERFLRSIEHVRIPIIAGIWPLVSRSERRVPGQRGPGRRRAAGDHRAHARRQRAVERRRAVAEGIAIAREMFEQVRGTVQGVQVAAPFGKVELALKVFDGAPEFLRMIHPRVQTCDLIAVPVER